MSGRLLIPAKTGSRTSHRWWILAVVSFAQFMLVLDTTIMNVALPSAQADLDFTDGQPP